MSYSRRMLKIASMLNQAAINPMGHNGPVALKRSGGRKWPDGCDWLLVRRLELDC